MIYVVDIDHTICDNTNSDYPNSVPYTDRIAKINSLYDRGHTIIYWTARGMSSGADWTELTKQQLEQWGVKHHELKMFKPKYDFWIDDKAINSEDFFKDDAR
jgi:hypothetical protein